MTAPLTDGEAARLEELALRATPGPWDSPTGDYVWAGEVQIAARGEDRSFDEESADMHYIAALDPATVLRLLAERKALRSALQRSRGCITGLLARTPVRDVTETLGKIDAALGDGNG